MRKNLSKSRCAVRCTLSFLHENILVYAIMNLSAAETAEYPEISPQLTGGDLPCGIFLLIPRGKGEGAQSSSITPALTLPRQGGGEYMVTPQQRLWGIENLINVLQRWRWEGFFPHTCPPYDFFKCIFRVNPNILKFFSLFIAKKILSMI